MIINDRATTLEELLPEANVNLIPEYMRGGLFRWITRGIEPGSFLSAVLCNDLREAVGRADDVNRERLADYIRFLYNYAPSACWGSPVKFKAWAGRGLAALEEDDDDL